MPIIAILFVVMAFFGGATYFSSIGDRVEVPSAHLGRVLSPQGYTAETIPPSTFRLGNCFFWEACDKIVLVSVQDSAFEHSYPGILMPKDKLKMSLDVRGIVSVREDQKSIDLLMSKVAAKPTEDTSTRIISMNDILKIYFEPVIRDLVRPIVSEYTIMEVASSREEINARLTKAMQEAVKGSPIQVKRIALADAQYPDVITVAQEKAKERQIAIETAKADATRRLVELQAEIEQAKKSAEVTIINANAAKEAAAIYSEAVSPAWLSYRNLEVMEMMASNKNAVFIPFGALGTVGLDNSVMRNRK